MGIPYGTRYTSQISTTILKTVNCEICNADYVYECEVTAMGGSTSVLWLDNEGAKAQAQATAQAALQKALQTAFNAVACPRCGWLQKEMVGLIKGRGRTLIMAIGIVAGAALLVWGLITRDHPQNSSEILIPAGIVVSVAAILLGQIYYFLRSPNSGHAGAGDCHRERASASRGVPKEEWPAREAARLEQTRAQYVESLRQLAIAMIHASPAGREEKIKLAPQILREFANIDASEAELSETLPVNLKEVVNNLKQLKPQLSQQGISNLVLASAQLACADGPMDRKEWRLLLKIAEALDMTAEQVNAFFQ